MKAYTLVETILYIALTGLILGAIGSFVGTVEQANTRNQVMGEVDQQAIQTMNSIITSMENADTISAPQPTQVDSSLIFSNFAGLENEISLNGDRVQIIENAGNPIFLSSSNVKVTLLEFENLSTTNAESVSVKFTIEYNNLTGRKEQDYSRTYYDTYTLR